MSELLLCALARLAKPSTAAQIHDKAVELAQEAGWHRRNVPLNVHAVSAGLRGMCGALTKLEFCGNVREDGKSRPLYYFRRGVEYDPEMPQEPGAEKDHVALKLKPHQLVELFDSFQAQIETQHRQNKERTAMEERHHDERMKVWERWRARLAAAGVNDA